MINYIWFFMIGGGLLVALIKGDGGLITKSIVDSSSSTVTLVISFVGVMCLWTGIMKIAEESELTKSFSRFLKLILKFLFKDSKDNEKIMGPVVMNLTANILGLGNAATPFGIKAMEEFDVVNPKKGVASNDMALFLVLNANCIQILPTTILSIRSLEGSVNHGGVIFGILFTTVISCVFSVITCKILQKVF